LNLVQLNRDLIDVGETRPKRYNIMYDLSETIINVFVPGDFNLQVD